MAFLALPSSYNTTSSFDTFSHIAHMCLDIGAKRFIFGKSHNLWYELDTSNSIALKGNNGVVGILLELFNVAQLASI